MLLVYAYINLSIFRNEEKEGRLYVSRHSYSEIYEISVEESQPTMQQIAELQPSLYFLQLDGVLRQSKGGPILMMVYMLHQLALIIIFEQIIVILDNKILIRMKGKSVDQKQQQLQKKLSSIRDILELKKIYGNVEQQNNTLRQDILNLKYKVDILMQKQKNKSVHHTREDQTKAKELESCQKELKLQYRIMQELKKRQEYSKQEKGSEEINEHKLHIENELKRVQLQLSTLKTQSTDLKNETIRLQKTIAAHEEQMVRNQPKIEQFSQENGQLRKKILSLKKLSTQKEYQSAKIMNSMYTIKTRHSKNQEMFNEVQKKKLSTIKEQKLEKQELLNLPELQKEVEQLRKNVKKKEKEFISSEISNLKHKQELIDKNKEDVRQLKEKEDKRSRLNNQLNKYKKIWQKHVEMQSNNKNLKEFHETGMVAEQFNNPQILLRNDFAGILGGKIQFDDRLVLKQNTKSFMTGFYIYQLDHVTTAKNLLVAIRAIYDDAEASATNIVPIPGHYLAKCKMSKYTLVEGDFIKLFKVKYNANQSRILKLEIRTNKNNRYEFGDKRSFTDLLQGQNVYGFDISIQEYPVSLFGSYNTLRSQWFLQSLGVEINDL